MCFAVHLSAFCSDYFFGHILIVSASDDFSFALVAGFAKRVEIFFPCLLWFCDVMFSYSIYDL